MDKHEEILTKISDVLWYLKDDKDTGRKGMYSSLQALTNHVDEIDDRLKKVEEKQRFVFLKLGGGGISIGAVVTWLISKWDEIVILITK